MAEIAFVLESFPQLSETFVLDQMRSLASDGHKVHVVADQLNDLNENVFGDLSFITSLNNRWKMQNLISGLLGHFPWFISSRLKVFFDVISDGQLRKYDLLSSFWFEWSSFGKKSVISEIWSSNNLYISWLRCRYTIFRR